MFRAENMIKGNQGTLTATIKGRVKELAYVRHFEMNAEVADVTRNSLGSMVTGHKSGMINLTGTMTIDAVTSDFIDLLIEYKRTGAFPYISMVGTNDDPESAAGTRRVKFDGIRFNTFPLYLIDIDLDHVEETLPCTANDFDYLDKFTL